MSFFWSRIPPSRVNNTYLTMDYGGLNISGMTDIRRQLAWNPRFNIRLRVQKKHTVATGGYPTQPVLLMLAHWGLRDVTGPTRPSPASEAILQVYQCPALTSPLTPMLACTDNGNIGMMSVRRWRTPRAFIYPNRDSSVIFRQTPALASMTAPRSLLSASSTSSSVDKLKDARTNAVFPPLGKKAVPGKARTPRSSALVLINVSESSSLEDVESADSKSLNLGSVLELDRGILSWATRN